MISVEEALARILGSVTPLPPRTVPLSVAQNRFAAQAVFARLPMPLFDNSAMDGYAVIAHASAPDKSLTVVGEQPAGVDRKLRVSPGEAVRVFTGAPIPAGADAVIMQEDVTANGSQIAVKEPVEPGQYVRRRGCDLGTGQKIVESGQRIRAETLALLAAQGLAEIEVGGEVISAVVSTGDELVQAGEDLLPGQLYDSNSVLLCALLEKSGATVATSQHCGDDAKTMSAVLRDSARHHAVVISGGVSVGTHDLVKDSLAAIGAKVDLWRVAVRPGKPFLFGQLGESAIFGLPGNPVSAFVTFFLFVRPAILKMMGAADSELSPVKIPARLAGEVQNEGDRPHYLRGRLSDGTFTPTGRQESHALYSLSRSNALLLVNTGEKMAEGTTVEVLVWD